MNINQKGFAPILVILLVLLAAAVGYFVYVKKATPSVQSPISATVTEKSDVYDKKLAGLVSITFPSYCSFSGNVENGWTVDCGRSTKNDARGFMGKILEPQGWKFCDSGLATAHWWKNGVTTGISESESDSNATSYPFRVTQSKEPECQ